MILRRLFGLLLITVALLAGTAGISVRPAEAQLNTGLQEVGQTIKLPTTDPRVIAVRIINVALGLIGIILVSLIIYAGFLWMTSGGDAEKTGKAKKIITNAIIGLLIILSAWAITKFVIERLLEATQEGGGGITSDGGYGGGLGGGGGGQAFLVKSITPSGNVSIRNVEVKIVFNKTVDETSAGAILVSKVGGSTVGGTIDVKGSVVKFTPAEDCPAPNADRKCFDGDADYTVKVGSSVKSAQGQTVSCGGFGSNCDGAFHTGNLVDTRGPTVEMSYPVNGQSVSVDYLQDLQAEARDDSGIGMVEFFEGSNSVFVDAPIIVPSPTQYSAYGSWDTAGAILGSHTLTAKASDIDTNIAQSSGITVVVRPVHCFNGVQDDPPETGVDCGGNPGSDEYCGSCPGGSCSKNADCASGFCQSGQCVEKPVIQSVGPINGKPGTFVTLKGINFGNAQGTVKFLGGEGPGDDVVALPPKACVDAGSKTWSSTEVIIAVPVGGKSGPIEITNKTSNLTDATNDGVGPSIPDFLIDDTVHPGLCALAPSFGTVGKEVDAIGSGFGGASDKVKFGAAELTGPFTWSETKVRFQVPVVNSAPYPVLVKVGQMESNSVQFTVVDKVLGEAPSLASLDPTQGPAGTYITLLGKNFGWSMGTVKFTNQAGEAIGDVSFPPACSSAFWRDDMIVIKAPEKFTNNTQAPDGAYKVKIKRPDLKESNELDFNLNSTLPLKPGICAISPAAGPENTAVKLFGDQFGFKPTVTFSVNKLSLIESNTNQEVKTSVPIGALTGNVKLTAGGQDSNKVNFQVRNCNEAPAEICSPATEQCCPTGACKLKTEQCGAVAERAEFAWSMSTGQIPIAPYVIEECWPENPSPPTPSPSPWLGRTGGDQAPVTSQITIRFSKILDASTVNKAAFRFLKCTSNSSEPCATTEPVNYDMSGSPYSENDTQSVVKIFPELDLATSTVYQVKVASTVKALGLGGGTMEVDAGCGTGSGGQNYGYCFRFKTKNSAETSAVGSVNVIPTPFTMNNSGDTKQYTAVPLYAQDRCIILNCNKFDWNWYTGTATMPDGRANITNDKFNGLGKCEQTGTGLIETGSVPVDINAEIKLTSPAITGIAKLFINFQPPKIEAYGPDCDQACLNGLIWARFSSKLKEATVLNPDNVVIQKCYNENCVESELSLPLDTSKMKIDLLERLITVDSSFIDGLGKHYMLEPGGFYRVLLKGGPGVPEGIIGYNGVPMTGLNHPLGFQWTFRTKLGTAGMCKAERVDMVPLEKYEKSVIGSQLFAATPYGSPDNCNAGGQPLSQSEGAVWEITDTKVADLYATNGGLIDTGGNLPAGCTQKCLATGAQAENGKVAVCGNGIIETTDPIYCKAGKTPKNDSCQLMPFGSRAGEECEPSMDPGKCDINTCLWKGVALVESGGTCGNGVVDYGAGEACDFGPTCVGGSNATSSPPVPENSLCVTPGQKTACAQANGQCDMHSYRGCSASCRHLGSSAGKSTCGNSDNLGDGKDCDDGNTTSNDGCSALCLHEGSEPSSKIFSVCGNAILEPGETCDGSPFPSGCNPKTCLHTGKLACASPTDANCCGNKKLESGEDCDDRNLINGDGCSANCLFEGSSPTYYKGNILSPSFCSNGIMERGEQCEAGLKSNEAARLIEEGKSEEIVLDKAYGAGDGLIDNQQLAFIVGEALPDPDTGIMSSDIKVKLEGNDGQAKYGLQCGFTDESSCESILSGTGLDDYGCCAPRPKINYKYPNPMDTGVCRNVQISGKFNVAMKTESVLGNFEILAEQPTGSCPTGTTEILIAKIYGQGLWNWFKKTWDLVVSWFTGMPAYAQKWCKGGVTGQLKAIDGGATSTVFTFTLDKALAAGTLHRVRFLGDNSMSTDPLSDNADINKRLGVKTARGVVHEFEVGTGNGELIWEFTTGKDICLVNVVTVQDVTPEPDPPDKAHPYLFVNKGNIPETRNFVATAQAIQDGIAVPLSPVVEYGWKWAPWASSQEEIVKVANLSTSKTGTLDKEDATSGQINGNAILTAFLEITKDEVSAPSTTGRGLQGIASVAVLVCENPWPDIGASPFRDVDPKGTVPKSSFVLGDTFYGGPYYNFSIMYCRDAGRNADQKDDLPQLEINQVMQTKLDAQNGILRQYLFTYPPEDENTPEQYRGLQKDGIGIRIATNPQHLSPAEWFRSKGFGSSPKSITVDGYPAVVDGTTIYVAAANRTDSNSGKIYSNIYLISHNPDAKEVTKKIYDQMVKYLTFNINMLNQSNVCVKDGSTTPYTDITLNYGKPIKCSADWTCLTIGTPGLHCDSDKLKIIRDTTRITDFQFMARTLENSKDSQGKYPQALAGTYLRNFSNSLWSSWVSEIGQAVGKTLPIDPVNRFLTCGRCLVTNTPCRNNSDCPNAEKPNTCQGGIESGGAWSPNSDLDPQTCWDQKNHKYVCPRIGATEYGPSRLYQYQSLVGGTRYELGSEFEIPPADPGNWWSPTLAQGVYQCITTSTLGNFCAGTNGLADDKLCRPCPDPNSCKTCEDGTKKGRFCAEDAECKDTTDHKCLENTTDYPIISGACRQFGGTYKYSGICTNQAFGDSGVCGDGVLNLSGGEVCEIGQTKYLPCDVPVTGEKGFRRQTCDPNACKGYIDDIQHPECIPANVCGNGRIDKACGGVGSSPCLSDIDCSVGVSCTPVEICDDGSLNNTYGHCSNKCQGPAGYCGDGALSPGEVCDNGASNGTTGNGDYGGTCSLDCKGVGPFCGDAEINGPEQCDGGAETTKSRICSAGPLAGKVKCEKDEDCGTGGQCGQTNSTKSCVGVTEMVNGIARETQHAKACDSSCSWSDWSPCQAIGTCGDGIKDLNEECDSGQGNGNTKACTAECRRNVCGDKNTYLGVEECDSGSDNGKITCSADYDSMCLSCSTLCKFQATAGGYCGDANKNGPEQCDGNGPAPASVSCPFTEEPFKTDLCPIVVSPCTQPPCGATLEPNITCKSLGYDFSKNTAKPAISAPSTMPTGISVMEGDEGALALDVCPQLSFLAGSWAKKMMYHKCLGLTCNISTLKVTYQNPLPSVKDFWKCVAVKGQDYGIKVYAANDIVGCTPSCGFGNCIRCSDEPGTGKIEGRVIDKIYKSVIPGARISLLYKGTKVDEVFADQNGYFKFTSLNTNSACTAYRMVVDFYQDNPCTNLTHDGYDCCETDKCTPPFNSTLGIDEGAAGGYIPLTTDTFSHDTYFEITNTDPESSRIAEIYLMPRPQSGTAYLTIDWDNEENNFREMWQIHTILPLAFVENVPTLGFEVPNGGEMSKNWEGQDIGKCDYTKRPVSASKQCARDITWKSMGKWDISTYPYAKNICLRKLGDVSTSAWKDDTIDACPFEGPETCLATYPANVTLGENKWTIIKCMNKTPGDPGYEICNRCGADASHYKSGKNQCEARIGWEDCIDITYPPVSSMVNYHAMSNYGGFIEFVFAKNGGDNSHRDLYQQDFKATVVSSDMGGNVVVKNYSPKAGSNYGYVWRIAQINPTTGDIVDINSYAGTDQDVLKVEQAENITDNKESASAAVEKAKPVPGMACYRHQLQCGDSKYICNNSIKMSVLGLTFEAHTLILPLNETCNSTNCTGNYECGDLESRVFSHINW